MNDIHSHSQFRFRRFSAVFFPVFFVIILLSWAIYYFHYIKIQEDILKAQEENLLIMQKKLIAQTIKSIVADLNIIASNKDLKELVEHLDHENCPIPEDFVVFSKYKGIYDQVRVLDSLGWEKVRVDLRGQEPVRIPDEQLQFKGERYYFKETISLERGEIFMSPFDLNIERGEIEKPLKPMIRFGMPLFDSEGKKVGILIVNYLGKKIIDELEDLSADLPGHLLLLNNESYWLKGLEPEKEWGFMYPDRRDVNFAKTHPDMWQQMINSEGGQLLTSDGLYTFNKIYPLREVAVLHGTNTNSALHNGKNDYCWIIISYVSPHDIYQKGEIFIAILCLSDLIFLFIFGAVTWRLVLANEKRKIAEEQLKRANQNLEDQVSLRTRELLDANKALKEEIKERMKAIEEKTKMESRLRQAQKMEAIGTLAGGIAHDFNNILTPILGFAELLSKEVDEDSPLAPQIEQIFTASQRAKEMVKQILTFSRQSEHELSPLKVQFLLKEVVKLLRSTLPKNIEIETDIKAEVKSVLADPTQIHQIMMNLCTNAYHSMRDTGGTLYISLGEVDIGVGATANEKNLEPGNYIKIEVRDTGDGIPPEIQEKIFEPYFTTKRKEEGTGLGLSVILGIVQTLKGHIDFQSEPGKGTTFSILLPTISDDSFIQPVQEKKTNDNVNGTEKILVVDDEEQIVRLEKKVLENLGYAVTTANSPEIALEIFEDSPEVFDLVITDMSMPNMTGTELVTRLKQIRPDLLTIVCTGFSENINAQKARELGIQGYITKPVTSVDFARTVRDILDKKQM